MFLVFLYYKDWVVHISNRFEKYEDAIAWGEEHLRKKHGSNKHKWYKIKVD